MTSAGTNYGVILGKTDSAAYTSIGEVVSVDPPEYMNPEVEATNHGSSGRREFIASGLKEMGAFKATVNVVNADLAKTVSDLEAGTKTTYELKYPNGLKQHFSAIVTSIKLLTADAQNPDVAKAEITFRPSDSLSLSS